MPQYTTGFYMQQIFQNKVSTKLYIIIDTTAFSVQHIFQENVLTVW